MTDSSAQSMDAVDNHMHNVLRITESMCPLPDTHFGKHCCR